MSLFNDIVNHLIGVINLGEVKVLEDAKKVEKSTTTSTILQQKP